MDLQTRIYQSHPFSRSVAQREVVGLQELYNKDVEAAVAWLKERGRADTQHLAMTGTSGGHWPRRTADSAFQIFDNSTSTCRHKSLR